MLFDLEGSNRVWQLQDTSVNTSILGIRAGIFYDFLPTKKRRDNDYSIIIGLAWLYRGIFGDLGQGEDDKENLRKRFLNTEEKRFFFLGARNKCWIRMKIPVCRIVFYPFFCQEGKEREVAGLTNLQLVTTIRFVGGFPIKLN